MAEPLCPRQAALAQSVARLCTVLPVKHVAAYCHLDRKTVKRIDKRYLQAVVGPINLAGVETLVMDEFAIQKGHRYAAAIVEPLTQRVLTASKPCSLASAAACSIGLTLEGKDRGHEA